MTTTPEQPSRLDRAEALAIQNTEAIANIALRLDDVTVKIDNLTVRLDNLTVKLDNLTDNVDRVLARSAILDDVLLELRDSHEQQQIKIEEMRRNQEQHQRNFEENQRVTNAALNQLGAILLQLTRVDPPN